MSYCQNAALSSTGADARLRETPWEITPALDLAGFLRQLAARIGQPPGATTGQWLVGVVELQDLLRIRMSFGETCGESVVRALARCLDDSAGGNLAVTRLDGHRFAILRRQQGSLEQVEQDLRTLLSDVAGQVARDALAVQPRLRLGATLYPLEQGTARDLLDRAVAALDLFEDAVALSVPTTRRQVAARLRMERDLRRALRWGEFSLYYQPVVDGRCGRVVGAEALIRWHHPLLGLVQPDRFIPLAEETGLIEPLGRWVLESACETLGNWCRQGLALRLSVNVSARQCQDPGLVAFLAALMRQHEIPAGYLELEITETAMLADGEAPVAWLEALRALGVRIAIDDFGTGYAGFAYLRRLPVDRLKIDRAFVHQVSALPRHAAICRSLLTLAREIGLTVTAEGAEESADIRVLSDQGCELFQGFYYSPPLPANDFRAFLARPVGVGA